MRGAPCLVLAVLAVPLATAGAASVEIHPAGPVVPENLLRIELRFDRPQPLPFEIERVKLLDDSGREIPHALLDLTLPDANARRITVLMDPGRVKSGVGPHLQAGRALKQGTSVSLHVAGTAEDPAPTVKTWRVTAPADHPLQPRAWTLALPRAGSRDALGLSLPVPLGSAAEDMITVADETGRRVEGLAALDGGDAQWRFTPTRPWSARTHQLVTHPGLEDAAGNRTCAAFEDRLGQATHCESIRLDFRPIGAPPSSRRWP